MKITKKFDSEIHDRLKLDAVREARYLAIQAHTNQTYGDKPYYHHILYCEKVIKAFGFYEKPILIAIMLHDAVEDGDLTIEGISERFGPEVADIVWRVTDASDAEILAIYPKVNREYRKTLTYPKTKESRRAIIVKLGDRIANVEYGHLTENTRKLSMYKKEHGRFRRELYNENHGFRIQNMWGHLDGIINLIR